MFINLVYISHDRLARLPTRLDTHPPPCSSAILPVIEPAQSVQCCEPIQIVQSLHIPCLPPQTRHAVHDSLHSPPCFQGSRIHRVTHHEFAKHSPQISPSIPQSSPPAHHDHNFLPPNFTILTHPNLIMSSQSPRQPLQTTANHRKPSPSLQTTPTIPSHKPRHGHTNPAKL